MKKTTFVLITGLLLSVAPVGGAETPRPQTKSGYRCLFIGHSFFVPVARSFQGLPKAAGIKNHAQMMVFSGGRSGSPGQLWTGPRKRQIETILQSGGVTLLGMTSYDKTNSSFEHYKCWIDLALKYNPKTEFFIGMPWAKGGGYRKLDEYSREIKLGEKALFGVVQQLRKAYPKNRIIFANYGMASIELKRLFEAGKLPDVKNLQGLQSAVYRDRLGHACPILLDLASLVWLATLYDVDLEKVDLKSKYRTDLKAIAAGIVKAQASFNKADSVDKKAFSRKLY